MLVNGTSGHLDSNYNSMLLGRSMMRIHMCTRQFQDENPAKGRGLVGSYKGTLHIGIYMYNRHPILYTVMQLRQVKSSHKNL